MALLALPLAACAAPLPANVPDQQPETITLRTPGSLSTVTIDGTRVFGPTIEVARYGNEYRGRSANGLVDLRLENGTIEGTVGSDRTELHVEKDEAGGFTVRGMNRGMLGELEVRSDRFVGRLGGCSFDLHQVSDACGKTYSGPAFCGSSPYAEITLPPSIAALEPIDRAALLAIFLGG
jgi:hypothetical protein